MIARTAGASSFRVGDNAQFACEGTGAFMIDAPKTSSTSFRSAKNQITRKEQTQDKGSKASVYAPGSMVTSSDSDDMGHRLSDSWLVFLGAPVGFGVCYSDWSEEGVR